MKLCRYYRSYEYNTYIKYLPRKLVITEPGSFVETVWIISKPTYGKI